MSFWTARAIYTSSTTLIGPTAGGRKSVESGTPAPPNHDIGTSSARSKKTPDTHMHTHTQHAMETQPFTQTKPLLRRKLPARLKEKTKKKRPAGLAQSPLAGVGVRAAGANVPLAAVEVLVVVVQISGVSGRRGCGWLAAFAGRVVVARRRGAASYPARAAFGVWRCGVSAARRVGGASRAGSLRPYRGRRPAASIRAGGPARGRQRSPGPAGAARRRRASRRAGRRRRGCTRRPCGAGYAASTRRPRR